jgi:CelD/BcsL family acetyltransferase involved in cellulose biosynthesis
MKLFNKDQAIEFIQQRAELLDSAATQSMNPFACSAWVLHFIEQIAEDSWTFIVPESAAHGQGLMLLYSENRMLHRCTALSNYYSSLYSPLVSTTSNRKGAIGELVHQLITSRRRCAVINFNPLDGDAVDTKVLASVFSDQRWYVKRYFCFGNWYLPCEDLIFDEYMKQRDSKLFNTWSRKSKKFNSANGARVEIVAPSRVEAGMDAYDCVYAQSWKKPEPYPNFVRGWARICARNGWLRLGLAFVEDVPIAAQFWFTIAGHAYIFKLAYDEKYSKWSAGTVLTAHMIKHALEVDRVVEIDYLTGDDAYKQSWMTKRRERVGLLLCNPRTLRGLARAAAEFSGEVRQRLRGRTSGLVGSPNV